MDVREKLVEQAISHFWYGVSHDIFSEPVKTYAKLAIEALEKENGVTVQEWIPVTERLPENNQWALCFMKDKSFGTFCVFQWNYIDWQWNDGNERWKEKDVTHWMPLPQPPKGE